MIQVLERGKYYHKKTEYAFSNVPIELWLEVWIRQSKIYPQIYVWIETKERSNNVNNVGNKPG